MLTAPNRKWFQIWSWHNMAAKTEIVEERTHQYQRQRSNSDPQPALDSINSAITDKGKTIFFTFVISCSFDPVISVVHALKNKRLCQVVEDQRFWSYLLFPHVNQYSFASVDNSVVTIIWNACFRFDEHSCCWVSNIQMQYRPFTFWPEI